LTTSQKECVADIVDGEEEKCLIVVGIGKGREAIGVNRAVWMAVYLMRGEEKWPRRKGSLEYILLDKFFKARCGAAIIICDKAREDVEEAVLINNQR
jgi:hypothetical protein